MADPLGLLKRWEVIPVNDIVAFCGAHGVARRELEARLEASGYFYSIAFDAYMPPAWVEQQRSRLT